VQPRHDDGARQLTAAGFAAIHRDGTATIAMRQAALGAGPQKVGDDMAVAAHLHCVLFGT
jgi:hypothetical protein